MTTYVNIHTGEIINTSIKPGKNWSAVTRYIDKDGKERLRFKLNGATVELEEV